MLLGVSEDAIAFRRDYMNFAVIECRDVALFHKNKDLLHRMIMGYLCQRALRMMMLREEVVIDAPYALLPGESASLSRELTEILELGLGIRVRGISVVSRRP
jgi:hypothetical protein